MDRKIIPLLIGFVFMTLNSCHYKTEKGLVAWYPFDGDARNKIGIGCDGIVQEAVPTSDRFGHVNKAYRFNGSSAYILAAVKNMPAVDHPQSLSWWFMIDQPPVYSDSLGADNMIALVDTAHGIGVQAGYRGPGYHTPGLDTWYWGGRTVLVSQPPAENIWHHCVYTYDGQTHRLYLDGQETAHSAVKPQSGNPDMLMFGNYPGGDQFFTGSLDDIRIYNRAITQSCIENLYREK